MVYIETTEPFAKGNGRFCFHAKKSIWHAHSICDSLIRDLNIRLSHDNQHYWQPYIVIDTCPLIFCNSLAICHGICLRLIKCAKHKAACSQEPYCSSAVLPQLWRKLPWAHRCKWHRAVCRSGSRPAAGMHDNRFSFRAREPLSYIQVSTAGQDNSVLASEGRPGHGPLVVVPQYLGAHMGICLPPIHLLGQGGPTLQDCVTGRHGGVCLCCSHIGGKKR